MQPAPQAATAAPREPEWTRSNVNAQVLLKLNAQGLLPPDLLRKAVMDGLAG